MGTPGEVLLYWPNVLGYIRLALYVIAATIALGVPPGTQALAKHVIVSFVLLLFSVAHALDFLDGVLARRLGQSSKFGEVFDVALDNSARSLSWFLASHASSRSIVTAMAA